MMPVFFSWVHSWVWSDRHTRKYGAAIHPGPNRITYPVRLDPWAFLLIFLYDLRLSDQKSL